MDDETMEALIEYGLIYKSGKEYFVGLIEDSEVDIKKISEDEAEILISLCEVFNEVKKQEYLPRPKKVIKNNNGKENIFDNYDNENDVCALLICDGWKIVRNIGDKVYFCRPNKTYGVSASWNAVPGRFYCFTTSTIFESGKVYKPYAVYTMLEHGGNFKKAAEALKNLTRCKGGDL